MRPAPPVTPDGRYIVVRGRLWRRSNPNLSPEQRQVLVAALMDARRAVRAALKGQDRGAWRRRANRSRRPRWALASAGLCGGTTARRTLPVISRATPPMRPGGRALVTPSAAVGGGLACPHAVSRPPDCSPAHPRRLGWPRRPRPPGGRRAAGRVHGPDTRLAPTEDVNLVMRRLDSEYLAIEPRIVRHRLVVDIAAQGLRDVDGVLDQGGDIVG